LQHYSFTAEAYYEREDNRDRWVLDAPYQRGRLWTEEQSRNLIKSLLQGIPIGIIFVNNRGRFEASDYVVDGKQRIGAIRDFVAGRLAVPSEWFEKLDLESTSEMVSYKDLSRRGQRHFDSCSVATAESKLPDLKGEAELYLLVNFGGVAQTEIDRERAREITAEPERDLLG